MNSGRVMNLRVTIPAESRRMNVGKDVIRILGSPAYICVLQRKDRKSIAITPCAAEHQKELRTACANVDSILGQHHIRDHVQRTEQTL